jgi:hypothetical protein
MYYHLSPENRSSAHESKIPQHWLKSPIIDQTDSYQLPSITNVNQQSPLPGIRSLFNLHQHPLNISSVKQDPPPPPRRPLAAKPGGTFDTATGSVTAKTCVVKLRYGIHNRKRIASILKLFVKRKGSDDIRTQGISSNVSGYDAEVPTGYIQLRDTTGGLTLSWNSQLIFSSTLGSEMSSWVPQDASTNAVIPPTNTPKESFGFDSGCLETSSILRTSNNLDEVAGKTDQQKTAPSIASLNENTDTLYSTASANAVMMQFQRSAKELDAVSCAATDASHRSISSEKDLKWTPPIEFHDDLSDVSPIERSFPDLNPDFLSLVDSDMNVLDSMNGHPSSEMEQTAIRTHTPTDEHAEDFMRPDTHFYDRSPERETAHIEILEIPKEVSSAIGEDTQSSDPQLLFTTEAYTDSGYASNTTRTTKPVEVHTQPYQTEGMEQEDEVKSIYSDVSGIPGLTTAGYIDVLADDLAQTIQPYQPKGEILQQIFEILPELLKAFALSLGYYFPGAMPRDVMVFIHRYRW